MNAVIMFTIIWWLKTWRVGFLSRGVYTPDTYSNAGGKRMCL